jgi:hypothetical protein
VGIGTTVRNRGFGIRIGTIIGATVTIMWVVALTTIPQTQNLGTVELQGWHFLHYAKSTRHAFLVGLYGSKIKHA